MIGVKHYTSDHRKPHVHVGVSRHALNPILSDAQIIDADGSHASVFLMPAAAALETRMPLIVAGTSGVFLLSAFVSFRGGAPLALTHLMTLCAFAIASIPALSSVWDSVRKRQIDIDVLMLLGAGLAAVIGSPMEGALLLFLFALSGALEEYALDRTQSAIVSLHNLTPNDAIVLAKSGTQRVAISRVDVGARVLVRPSDRVPLDGVVLEGDSAIDESAITGESLPRDKNVGDNVFAGTVNMNGRLVIEVTKSACDSTLSRILTLVTEARHKRASVQRLIDRVGPTYSICVIALAAVSGVVLHYGFGLDAATSAKRAIAVLIVCSPCALVIATPVAYLASIGAAALHGVLIKGGVYLEALAKARAMVFDKTGTLTTGRVRLTELITHEGIEEGEALRMAGALESSSSHPLAGAVIRRLAECDLTPYGVVDMKSIPGRGMSAMVNGRKVWIGRPTFAIEHIDEAHRATFAERVALVFASGRAAATMVIDGLPNLLVFEDTVRSNAAETLSRLRALGIERIEMLTGDQEIVARTIATELGLDGYRADLLPEDKLSAAEAIRSQHGRTAMVGDGVNDAPALAAADVGVAIGGIGADAALEAADIVLMNNNLEGVAWVYSQARRTAAIVRQNLVLAVGVIVVLSGFAVCGKVPLPLAVIGHEGSTVLVAVNALRLLKRSTT